MLFLSTTIVILVPLIFGIFLLSLFIGKKSDIFFFWEKLALAFPLGLGFLVLLMFLMASAKIPLTFSNIILAAGLIILFIVVTCCPRLKSPYLNVGIPEINIKRFSLLEIILTSLITFKVIYVYFASIVKPLIDVDAFNYYSIVAKGVFFEKTFFAPYLWEFIHDKPLFPYLAQGWAFIGLGTINDALFKILTPTLFLCLLVIFYSALRKYYPRKYCLLAIFLLSSLPFLVFHVATAYADFTITFYYTIASIYLFLFMKEFHLKNQEKADANLVVALLFLGLTIWTKRAGIVLVGINVFVLLAFLAAYRKTIDLKKLIIPCLLFFLILLPWLVHGQAYAIINTLKAIVGIGGGKAVEAVASTPVVENKAGVMCAIFLNKLFLYADWHLLWLLFLTTLIFFYKRVSGKPLVFLLVIILLGVSAIFVQFGTGEMFKWLIDGTLLDRLVMVSTPLALYFCAEVVIPSLKDNSLAIVTHASAKSKKGS